MSRTTDASRTTAASRTSAASRTAVASRTTPVSDSGTTFAPSITTLKTRIETPTKYGIVKQKLVRQVKNKNSSLDYPEKILWGILYNHDNPEMSPTLISGVLGVINDTERVSKAKSSLSELTESEEELGEPIDAITDEDFPAPMERSLERVATVGTARSKATTQSSWISHASSANWETHSQYSTIKLNSVPSGERSLPSETKYISKDSGSNKADQGVNLYVRGVTKSVPKGNEFPPKASTKTNKYYIKTPESAAGNISKSHASNKTSKAYKSKSHTSSKTINGAKYNSKNKTNSRHEFKSHSSNRTSSGRKTKSRGSTQTSNADHKPASRVFKYFPVADTTKPQNVTDKPELRPKTKAGLERSSKSKIESKSSIDKRVRKQLKQRLSSITGVPPPQVYSTH